MRDIAYEPGLIVGVAGPMWSEKTTELKRYMRRFAYLDLKVKAFQPSLNTRTERSLDDVIGVEHPRNILEMVTDDVKVVLIDEAQFFDREIVAVVDRLARVNNKMVMFGGLDLNHYGEGFGPMPELLAIAMDVIKCTAICMRCKKRPACRSQLIVKSDSAVLVGDKESYEARCIQCFKPTPKPAQQAAA